MSDIITTEEQKKAPIKSLQMLYSYVRPYYLMLAGVLVSLIITSLSMLAISEAIKIFIDAGITKNSQSNLDEALMFLIGTVVFLTIFTYTRFFLITLVGERVVTDLRHDIYSKMLKLSPTFFESYRSGAIISRMSADTTLLLTIIGSSLSVAMRNIVMLIGGLIMLVKSSGILSGMLVFLIPIVILPIVYLGKKLRVYARNSQDRVADLTAHSAQTLNALKIVQSYNREDHELSYFDGLLQNQLKVAFDRIALRGLLTALVIFLVFGGVAVILWNGGHMVLRGELSAGELSAFVYIAILCAGSVAALTDVLGELQKAAGATERIFEFLSLGMSVKETENPVDISSIKSSKIEFRDVSFSYDTKKDIFKAASFVIDAGKVTALVGKSGAGKTTSFMLLERFYDISSGDILIDGVNIKNLNLKDLRSQFTLVTQDPIIFADTVRNNIRYGKLDATDQEIELAAKQAGCIEFIDKMPSGFDTYLGDQGIKLSGGQRQRLTIARAILNNPKILLLDEATSSLDSENESEVQNALENLMKGRTTIVIAHRLSTVKRADKIIVLNHGKVMEEGTHQELIKNEKGLYTKLAKMQLVDTH
jgi:ATP-binding cassette subfamily B protein